MADRELCDLAIRGWVGEINVFSLPTGIHRQRESSVDLEPEWVDVFPRLTQILSSELEL